MKYLNHLTNIIHNRYLLFIIVFCSILNMILLSLTGDIFTPVIFILVGVITSFFNKNMLIVFMIALSFSNLIKYGTSIRDNKEGYTEKKPINMSIRKKYAVCIHNELRAVKTIKNNFYKNFIHKLNADIFIVARNNYKADTVNLFNENIIRVDLYDEIQTDIYINLHKLKNNSNYLNFSHLQWYYNYYKIYEIIGDILENNYEYIILTRSDFLHMFEFPDILQLKGETENNFWTYDGFDFGGINPSLICVPSIYIKEYLKSFFEILQDDKNINELNSVDLNIEQYTKFIFDKKGWKHGKIQSNAIFICDSAEEKTTWGQILYDEKNGFFYKHQEFYNNTMKHLQEYNEGKTWKYDENEYSSRIILY